MQGTNRGTGAVALVAILAAAGAAAAQPTYLATNGTTLYRAQQGSSSVETFALDADITCLVDAGGGSILAFGSVANGSGNFEVYSLDGYLSNSPSLSLVSDQLVSAYPAATFVGSTLYAYRNGSRNLVTVDLGTGAETDIGPSAPMQAPIGGATYDAATDTFFAMGRTDASLWSIDYAAGSGDPDATLIGALGIDFFKSGLEFFDGTLYGAVNDSTNGRFVAGTLSVTTGAFTADTVLFDGVLDGSVGFVVIPAPGGALLLALAGLGAARRRRA